MRLVVKFGDKRRYSEEEYEAIYQELDAAVTAICRSVRNPDLRGRPRQPR
jgi:hypothetical protein